MNATETPAVETATPTRKAGRPEKELQWPRGIFTVEDLYELNRGPRGKGRRPQVCKLTVRQHIDRKLESGWLTQVEPLKTGKPGKPASRFIRSTVKAGLDARSAGKTDEVPSGFAPAVVEAPLTEAVSVPVEVVPVETVPVEVETSPGTFVPVGA